MWNEYSKAPGAAGVSGVDLRCIWDVKADPSYDVHRRSDDRILLAVRTDDGLGRLTSETAGTLEVGPASLLVLEGHRLRRYWCAADRWHFRWFEFTVTGSLHFPLNRVMHVPAEAADEVAFRELFAALRRETAADRCVATAAFALLVYRWVARWRGERHVSPHAERIARVIDLMHEDLGGRCTIAELAAEAGMSERLFRDAFRAATGQSPKRFYDNLRLSMAAELLRLGIHTVSEVSERLGYSSPFHLSRAFRQRFGIPPSRLRGAP
ncbi:MAG: hypothetical protein A3K19_20025 [Lentisphaerae bacterium RIFOXYB12_FULL_65_16]|nr:MAG: hypothetical protein A3K18_31055 [Lentisphaerae bacterium RIFOXYA12_64_32]OGV93625.1 MAG: hypothetical protein A3K19_20025 [Lentisphaerae bacterium RIFOXYB12_FULL_65_16]